MSTNPLKRMMASAPAAATAKPKKPKNAAVPAWQNALSGYLEAPDKHPEAVVTATPEVVLIKDSFPKAKMHFLALPRTSAPEHRSAKGVSALSATDLPMLESLAHTLKQVQQAHPSICFKAGFHAVPSMAHLHMHIISDDMVSPCLKHKKHWNSFTTRFFIPLQDVIFEITEKGSVEVNVEESEALLKADLQCHKCTKTCKNMPELKKHLESHLEKEALLSNKAD